MAKTKQKLVISTHDFATHEALVAEEQTVAASEASVLKDASYYSSVHAVAIP